MRSLFSEGLTTKQVMIFGAFDQNYLKFTNLKKGIESQGFSTTIWNIKCNRWLQILRFLWFSPRLVRDAIRSRFILVPYPGWRSLYLAKILSVITRRKLVFDAFFSNYNTFVEDRKYVKYNSLKAVYHLTRDRVSCKMADIILLDTYRHIDYFANLLAINKEKFVRIFVGADIDKQMIMETKRSETDPLTLFFVGTFIPLQGTRFIIEAVHILSKKNRKFRFVMIGQGQESGVIDSLIEKLNLDGIVERKSYIPYPQLMELINNVDICLGIFGNTKKATRVIATKIFDYAGMNKIFITGKSKAMDELFVEGVDYIGSPFGDAKGLADVILDTMEHFSDLREILNPRKRILEQATTEMIGKNLMKDLKKKIVL